jgi:hypothetical protein
MESALAIQSDSLSVTLVFSFTENSFQLKNILASGSMIFMGAHYRRQKMQALKKASIHEA